MKTMYVDVSERKKALENNTLMHRSTQPQIDELTGKYVSLHYDINKQSPVFYFNDWIANNRKHWNKYIDVETKQWKNHNSKDIAIIETPKKPDD